MNSREKRKLNKVSKEVRDQYEDSIVPTLNERIELPPQPVLTLHPAERTAEQPKLQPLKKRNKIADVLFVTIMLFLVVFLASAVLQRYFVGSTIVVSGASMDPTYKSGTEVWVDKTRTARRGDVVVLYRYDVENKFFAEFAVGESTQSGGKYEKLIKRVVALAGDKLWLEAKDEGHVLVIETTDGEIIREDYYTVPGKSGEKAVFRDVRGNLGATIYVPYVDAQYGLGVLKDATRNNPFVVREGHFFYMGDNRYYSKDSREIDSQEGPIGDVPVERIIGVVTSIVKEVS